MVKNRLRILVKMTAGQQNRDLEKGLSDYLECERLLGKFFTEANFCFPNCISKQIGLYRTRMDMPGDPTEFPGDVGCCPYNYFNHHNYPGIMNWALLEKERLTLYGEPKSQCQNCDYHSPTGCKLTTHKSPVCLAFICDPFAEHLDATYNIRYGRTTIEEQLERILAGRESSHKIKRFQQWIAMATDRVQRQKGIR